MSFHKRIRSQNQSSQLGESSLRIKLEVFQSELLSKKYLPIMWALRFHPVRFQRLSFGFKSLRIESQDLNPNPKGFEVSSRSKTSIVTPI